MTITEFADQICTRAKDVDTDLVGTGFQRYNSDGIIDKLLNISLCLELFFM